MSGFPLPKRTAHDVPLADHKRPRYDMEGAWPRSLPDARRAFMSIGDILNDRDDDIQMQHAESAAPFVPTLEVLDPVVEVDAELDAVNAETICFGMVCMISRDVYYVLIEPKLHEVKAQICPAPSLSQDDLEKVGENDAYVGPELVLSHGKGELRAINGALIGQLHRKIQLGLELIQKQVNLVYVPLVHRETLMRELADAPRRVKDGIALGIVSIDILVSGERRLAERAGKWLSDYDMFLQRPYPWATSLEYFNPHFLELDVVSRPLQPSLLSLPLDPELTIPITEPITESPEEADIWQVLDEASVSNGLRAINVDTSILTELKRYASMPRCARCSFLTMAAIKVKE